MEPLENGSNWVMHRNGSYGSSHVWVYRRIGLGPQHEGVDHRVPALLSRARIVWRACPGPLAALWSLSDRACAMPDPMVCAATASDPTPASVSLHVRWHQYSHYTRCGREISRVYGLRLLF
jgi:hypothetical protein